MADAGWGNAAVASSPRMGHAVARAEGVATEAGVFVLLGRWQRFLDVTDRCNEDSRMKYRRAVTNFFADVYAYEKWPGPRDPLAIDEDDANWYIANRTPDRGKGRGYALRGLQSFYSFCEDRGAIARDPFRRMKIPRMKYGARPFLPPADLRALLAAAELVDPRARWAIQLQYGLGCRVGELVALRWSDVKDGRVVITDEKNDTTRDLPLDGPAAEAFAELRRLDGYCPKRGVRRPTVVGVGYERYRQWCKEAGVRSGVDVNTHLLRHTRATDMARAHVDTRTMMTTFGWQDPRMVDVYSAPFDPHVREAMALPIPE
jgi:integrase